MNIAYTKNRLAFLSEDETFCIRFFEWVRPICWLPLATLIATVTIMAAFMLPGGFNQSGGVDEGMAVLSKVTAFSVFLIANALAFGLSTSVFFYFLASSTIKGRRFSQRTGTTYRFLRKLVYWSIAGSFYCRHLFSGATLSGEYCSLFSFFVAS